MTNPQTEARAVARCVRGCATDDQYVELIDKIATALAAKDAELARLREFERQHDYCCCGDRIDAHNIGSGHAPVSVFDYEYWRAVERAERAEAQLAEARKALEPFAWIGQWLFARDLPDETPVVMVEGAGKPFALTRGMFKAAHTAARHALEAQGGEDVL